MGKFRASLIAAASVLAVSSCATSSQEAGSDARAALMRDYLMGRYADLTNDPSLAAENYLNALKRAPGDSVLIEGAVEAALVAGDAPRAAEAARMARARGAESPLGRLTLAATALQAGRYGDVRAAPSDGPPFDRLIARVLRAWAQAGAKQTDQALATLSEPSDAAPFSRLFDIQRAKILQFAGRDQEAAKAYQSAFAGGIRASAASLDYGVLLERLGQREAAIAVYRAALADGEDHALSAAIARAQRGDAPAPDGLTPAKGAAAGVLSFASMLLGQTEPGFYLPYLSLTLALDPSLDGARLAYAAGLQEMRLWRAAETAIAKVLPSSPLYERALVQEVLLLREGDKKDEALQHARAAVEQTHGRLSQLALADLLRDSEKWAEAEPIYDALIKAGPQAAPERWRLYFARGACRERLRRWAEAEADLKQALALSPEQPEVLNYLGYSWIDRGVNLKQGMSLIERAVTLKPDAGYIVDSLGWAYFKLGDYPAAVEQLERAVELLPDDPILNDHLGDAYWRDRRRAEARFQWSRSLNLKPAADDAASTRAKLAKGLPSETVRRTARAEGAR